MANKNLNARFQMRHDTAANWEAVKDTCIPLAGEFCVTMDGDYKGRFKIGDGTSTWGELDYASGDETMLAQSIMFDNDLVFTENFGKYKVSGGKVTIPAKDKSLYAVLLDAYSEDKNPSITQPSVGVSSSTAKAYEVGTSVNPAWSGSFNAGSYTYGPATGCTVTKWEVSNNKTTETATTQTGTFNAYVVPDGSNYIITLKGTYSDGAIPKTALGANYAAGQIKGSTQTKTTGAISGYRKTFYGTTTDKTAATTSAIIRGLAGSSNSALGNGSTFNVNIPKNAQRVIIAYPATLRAISSIKDKNGMSAEISSAFTSSTVDVQGADGYTAISYRVYTQDFAAPNDTANTYIVTI